MLNFDLGEMKAENGLTLWHQFDETTKKYAFRVINSLESVPVYKELLRRLPSVRVPLYFFRVILNEMYPFVLKGCVIRWYELHNLPIGRRDSIVPVYGSRIFQQLERFWDIDGVQIKHVNSFSPYIICEDALRAGLIKSTRASVKHFSEIIIEKFKRNDAGKNFSVCSSGGKLACHYIEGIDPKQRNDIHWFPDSGIRPEQVLIYFDGLSTAATGGKPIRRHIIQKLEAKGFQWVLLKKGVVEGDAGHMWSEPCLPNGWLMEDKTATLTEKWVLDIGNKILREVYYWRSFHDQLNVRVHYILEEGFLWNIAQAIAFDIDGKKGGFLVGRQRSELFVSADHMTGFHPKHIFFVWNKRAQKYLEPNYNQIEKLVITGYPSYVPRRSEDLYKLIRKNGATFVIMIFDNGCGREMDYSRKAMSEYYNAFLRLVIDDPSVGLIIKPKKEKFFKILFPEIQELFKKAVDTRRCFKVGNPAISSPAEASRGADMAVGIGSPTAVIEAVAAGCRGIFYDIANMKYHEFYKWGYERLIFDDLPKMIEAVKHYKNNPSKDFSFGDWSAHLDELDPFRDGKCSLRMGIYLRWLLEAFDGGADRNEAISDANRQYAAIWGSDKMVSLNSPREENKVKV